MKVLIVFNKYEYRGGEDTYVSNLTHLLKSHGHTVAFFTRDSRNIRTVFQKIQTALGLFWNPRTNIEFQSKVRSFQPDIAHFHNIFPLIPAQVYGICQQNNVRVVQTIHNYKHMCPKNDLYRNGAQCDACIRYRSLIPSILYGCYHQSRFASFFYVLSYLYHSLLGSFNKIDAFIFPSLFTLRIYSKYSRLPSKKFHHLPYVTYSAGGHKSKQLSFFLYAGRLTEEKGIVELARAFGKNRVDTLHIVGDGPQRDAIEQIAKEYKNIVYIGHKKQQDVMQYMRKAKGVIVPSQWYEVLPNVILEAATSRVPVWVPYQNRNLRLISQGSSRIYTYTDYHNLFAQLKKEKRKTKKFPNHVFPIEKMIHPDFHYKGLMKIYKGSSSLTI